MYTSVYSASKYFIDICDFDEFLEHNIFNFKRL